MAPREFRELATSRCSRAQELVHRFPAAREVLEFYSHLTEFQLKVCERTKDFDRLPSLLTELVDMLSRHGTNRLREAAAKLDESTFGETIREYWHRIDTSSVTSLCARVVLQPHAFLMEPDLVQHGKTNCCPRCGHAPQVGALYPLKHGSALKLVCSLCLEEWDFPRVCCSSCLETDQSKLEFHGADQFDYLQSQSCATCSRYILIVDKDKQPDSVPFVDELAALPLDVWNTQRGFEKQQPNFAGI